MTLPEHHIIDLSTWSRRTHFEFFSAFQQPFLDICVRIEITNLLRGCHARGESVFGNMLYAAMSALNAVPELRQRIVYDGEDVSVVEFERIHPSFTVLAASEIFNFCTADYLDDRSDFLGEVARRSKAMRNLTELCLDEDDRDDLVYVTSLPWLDFQMIGHAMPGWGRLAGSKPRIAWGMIVKDGERAHLSVQLSAHHALVDGLHAWRFFDFLGLICGEE